MRASDQHVTNFSCSSFCRFNATRHLFRIQNDSIGDIIEKLTQ